MLAVVMHGAKDLRVEQREASAVLPGEVRVRVAVGGICGSDLSYYRKGGVADFKIREPLTLGHEVAGEIIEIAAPTAGLTVGRRVAINPSRPCLVCPFCRTGRENLCVDMKFLGSAARNPHVQGAFSESVVVRADQCIPIPDGLPFTVAACGEPLAVALHAVRRAGEVMGRRVLVTGAGPIGLLCLAAAIRAGAAHVTVTDLTPEPLAIATRMGADEVIVVSGEVDHLAQAASTHAGFDVAFEATGAPASLAALPLLMRKGGRIVQVGMFPPGELPLGMNVLITREIDLIGSFRFDQEFAMAIELLAENKIDVTPILSGLYPIASALDAFEIALDRRRSVKVQLEIT